MGRRNGVIKKFEKYSEVHELRYDIYDIDDNLLYMPSIVHLDIKRGDEWKPIDITSSEFGKYIQSNKIRFRNNSYEQTFLEQTDKGPRGKNAFILDVIKAIKRKSFGPSWYDFIQSLIEGRIFLIITARGHEPEILRKSVEWIIHNYLTDDERKEMIKNLMKFQELFGDNPDDEIKHYLDLCDYVAVMSDYFKEHFKVDDMKVSQLVGFGKSMAIKRFLNRIREYSKQLGVPAKVGFSDDRRRTIDDVGEFLNKEKSTDLLNKHDIKYYLFDTSGKGKKKIRL